MIREVLDDAEKKRVKDKNVKHWLEVLETFSYDADNLLDEWRTRILLQEFERNEAAAGGSASIPRKKCNWGDGGIYDHDMFRRVMTTGIVDESEVHGRDSDKDVVIRKLLENSDQENGPLVVSIVGTGGIGKTTLAQLANGDKKLKGHFDERNWICVSDPFDETMYVPEDYSKWEPLKKSLKNGAPGSRILVTSRSERVVGRMGSSYMHSLGQISDSDCWTFFSRIAFSGRTNEDRED
ncbi:hypothetical protein CQW23_21782 [Capsicum baccatum]|uniref:NB-ARC domain-containing protein n=1 Tax=Capsicum baccatum TaxID=33114 RepID=A0A2G2VZ37_CAPBA|nr:hypothetical protein CQW23_21782 [Capsicum baccatum]